MERHVLLALLLCGLTTTVISQTTDFTTDDPPTTEDPEPWVIPTDIRCYTCDNEPDNDVCNGKDLPNENGTLVTCTGLEDPTCVTHTKINDNQDGWSFEKRCMAYDECVDEFYAQYDDPLLMSCMSAWYFYNPPPMSGLQCVWCCWKMDATWDFDKCNEEGYNWHWEPIDNGNNKWDHAVDRWPGHEKAGYEGGGGSGASTLRVEALSLLSTFLTLVGAVVL